VGRRGQNLIVADRASETRAEVALFQISVDSGTRKQITFPPAGSTDWMPAVSPDGLTLDLVACWKRVAVMCGLFRLPAALNGASRNLRKSSSAGRGGDGRDLLIAYRRSGRVHLWRQPVKGGRRCAWPD